MTDEIQLLQEILTGAAKELVGEMSIAEAAERIGIPDANLRRVLRGHGLPSLETSFWLLRAAGVDLLTVLGKR